MAEKIAYEYEILNVDETSKSMEVKYTSEFGDVLHVGVPMPSPGQDLTALLIQYSPVVWWVEQRRPTAAVAVGVKGNHEGWSGPRILAFVLNENTFVAEYENQIPQGVPYLDLAPSEIPDGPVGAWVLDMTTPDGFGTGGL
jgi:hypothetical protein